MDFSGFLELLAELKHAGPDGFEGLVAQLLESLTGERFHLSKSGYQGGRDMSSAPRSTYAECKHYFKSKLNKRALLGELEEAHQSNPMLEVWILVTSTRVDSLLKEALDRAAGQKGISVIYIDSEGDDDSQIALLWAHNVKIFRDF